MCGFQVGVSGVWCRFVQAWRFGLLHAGCDYKNLFLAFLGKIPAVF